MIAALYVVRDGPYAGRDDVDAWPEERDARTYDGPHPVIAHPPCKRWGRYWSGGPSAHGRFEKGDDGGCFAAAIDAVRKWGGVLEHPEASHAWKAFGICAPPRSGGWIKAALWDDGYTCCVEQGHYGHTSRKATWLYAHGVPRDMLPELRWGKAPGDFVRARPGATDQERRRAIKTGACQRLSKRQRVITPDPFVDVLLEIARAAKKNRSLFTAKTNTDTPATTL